MADWQPPGAATSLELLARRARDLAAAPAYLFDGAVLSNGALAAEAEALALRLPGAGLFPGGRCAILLPTGADFVRTLFAVQLADAVPVALNPKLPAATLARRLRALRADLAVVDPVLPAALSSTVAACRLVTPSELVTATAVRGLPAPSADGIAYLQMTSGTTGEPRAAILRQRNLLACLAAMAERLEPRDDDRLVGWVPLHHSMGLVQFVFLPLYLGRPVHLVPPGVATLGRWLATLSETGASITAGPDFAYRLATRMVDPSGLDLRRLRHAIAAAEPVSAGTVDAFERRFGVPGAIRPRYGLTEATLGVSGLAPGEPLRTDAAGRVSCGRPLAGIELAIVDAAGRPLPPGHPGEIRLRGAQVFAGYADDAEATARALVEGWLVTGDVGCLDGDGQLYLHGRLRQMIKRAGETIAPREVEEASETVPGVLRAAAIGLPADTGGELLAVVAEVAVTADDDRLAALAAAVAAAVRGAIGHLPGEVVLAAPGAIPLTDGGKLRHGELRRRIVDGDAAWRRAVLFGGERAAD